MNALQGTDWGNEVATGQIDPTGGDRDLSTCSRAGDCKGGCEGCAEILHGLNNALASMLLNAQVMEWKLPSYSRSRRYLHEIERNAQRGGELVKRLLAQLEGRCATGFCEGPSCRDTPSAIGAEGAAATPNPDAAERRLGLPLESAARSSPVFLSNRKKVPHTMV